jgi:RNA polymerase sigma factor (sigma-70 family)
MGTTHLDAPRAQTEKRDNVAGVTEVASIEMPHLGRLAAGRFSSEKRLAQRAAAGDAGAFATIFERYHQPIYRYCLSILHDPDDAKDALQSTMSSALSSLPGDGREIALKPWLFRVAHNHAISMLRTRRNHGGDEVLETVADPRAQARPEDRERLRELIDDLGQLPERQRAALTMRELNGLGFDEIGTALAMSPAAARQAVYEARVGLQRAVEGRSMECEHARELISAGDRRSLRGLRVRAHLRACAGCTDFRLAIAGRRNDLQALCPPLAVLGAAGALQGLLGGGAAGTAAATGGLTSAGGAAAGSLALKTAAMVAAGAIGAGAAGYAGLAENPLAAAEQRPAAAQPAAPPAAVPASDYVAPSADLGDRGSAAGPSAKPGESGRTPTHSQAGGNRPAHAGNGNGPPPHAGASPGKPPAHANAGGNPPAHSSAGGNPPAQSSAPSPAPAAVPAAPTAPALPPQAQGAVPPDRGPPRPIAAN